MKITEQNFIKEISLGNEKALEYCMLHYGGLVRSVIHRHIGSLTQYEEDCINEVFFAVWENIASYRPEKNPFANWIAGVARLKALDCLRRYSHHLMEHSWEEICLPQLPRRIRPFRPLKKKFPGRPSRCWTA